MSGIIFFGMIGVWVFISLKLTGLLTKIVKSPRKKSWVYPPVFILIFVTPIMDEIIGGFQFRALCKEEATATYEKEEIYDKTVYLKSADVG